MSIKLTIWHGVKHDDYTTTEVDTDCVSREAAIQEIKDDGGFFDEDNGFVPWYRINYIEYTYGQD